MSVVMPLPLWCENHIAFLHVDLLPLNSSEAAITFDDESQGKCSVSVRWRGLALINELQTRIYCIGSEGRLWNVVNFTLSHVSFK
jgi:hypothetical protein